MGYVHLPETGLVIASESIVAHDMVCLAWLLENRRLIPAEKRGFLDSSPLVANLANRWVSGRLGNIRDAFAADRLIKNEIRTIRDDRVLNRAYRVFGGAPKIVFEDANGDIPAALTKRLQEMTAV